jgi:AraC-like DNA-binding protein
MSEEAKAKFEREIDDYLASCYRTRSSTRTSELAQFLGISRGLLALMAKRLLGMSAKTALQTRQMARATRLLRETSLTIDEVGATSGFGDRRTFYRAFGREIGTSPGAFRCAKCP